MLELVKNSIENFSIDSSEYYSLYETETINVTGQGEVFLRGSNILANIKIDFGNTSGCKVYIGANVRGDFTVFFKGDNSLLYIGNHCHLNQVQIRSFQSEDFIAVGNGVTTIAKNVWISGHGAGKAKPAIIIGDDCMFSYDIVIRNSDAHPIFNLESGEQVNEPKGDVHIEPHVWIGEQVSVLKSTRIGACSIVALGSIVAKDVPRFSVASGVPAKAKVKPNTIWARGQNITAKGRAKYFADKYKNS